MATEQEIIGQITLTESALDKCDAEVHKAIAELDAARIARSGKSTDSELREAAEIFFKTHGTNRIVPSL